MKLPHHADRSELFLLDAECTTWHDETLWFVRQKRDKAVYATPEFQELRELASQIKDHTLSTLAQYLEQLEAAALANGISVMPLLLGAFAVRTVFTDLAPPKDKHSVQGSARMADVLRDLAGAFHYPGNLLRSSLIGTWIGILPGLGANIGAIISYLAASSTSRRKEEFSRAVRRDRRVTRHACADQ